MINNLKYIVFLALRNLKVKDILKLECHIFTLNGVYLSYAVNDNQFGAVKNNQIRKSLFQLLK